MFVYFQNQSNRGVNLFVNKIILILELGSTYRMSNVDEFIKITLDIKNPHRCYYKLCSSVIKMRGKLHVTILIRQYLNYSPLLNFNPCGSTTGLLADDAKNYMY
jgi:dimeric dUTPase (all-alpha-NTP-PPase superfamily)